ncbi:DnaB-like helicase C-terminal domain-containing protein [Bradyrhizobium glycinis]|uniref:DnaB-like helicase C-terminal domain-containing protein n=1 Tax=Bradyrhizobium glycinis TaxID=2751812 RepID=UPI0035DA337A
MDKGRYIGRFDDGIRRGDISENDFDALAQRRQEIRRIPLYIDATGALTVGQLAARALRLRRRVRPTLDRCRLYSAHARHIPSGSPNRAREVTEITADLKALELKLPIIVSGREPARKASSARSIT